MAKIIKNMTLLYVILLIFFLGSCATYNKEAATSKSGLHIASNMKDLDEYSKNSKPYIVKYYVKTNKKFAKIKKPIKLKPYIKYITKRINQIRKKGVRSFASVGALKYNAALSLAAAYHAKDMALNNHFSHLGSGKKTDIARKAPGVGSNFYERIIFFGYDMKPGSLAGEIITYTKLNIVGTYKTLPNFEHALHNFLLSPKHTEALMQKRFRYFGIGAYRNYNKIYWVIEFAE